jgi:lipopolysaccharide transport system ATP-binding protein
VTELPRLAPSLDVLLVGGGFLIRFDKEVAPGYAPPAADIHHPTGYWLTPALIALQHGIPVVWNGPGMHGNEVPAWAAPLLRLAFANSAYIAVRDEPSRATLAPFAGGEPVVVVPDTAFGIGRVLKAEPVHAAESARLREAWGLRQPYLVVQAAVGTAPFLRFYARHAARLSDYGVLALPIAPALTEEPGIVERAVPNSVRPDRWPHPLVIAELIRGAAAVVGHSYHLAITALTAGIPVFSPSGLAGKYSVFDGMREIHPLPNDRSNIEEFLGRLTPTAPGPVIATALDRLASHWDRVATVVRAGSTGSHEAVGRFWQALPRILEIAALAGR